MTNMFTLPSQKSTSYSGDFSYKYVDPLIKHSRSLKIVTPFIGAHYAKMLIEAGKGKSVRVITWKGHGVEDNEALRILQKGQKRYHAKSFAIVSIATLLLYNFNQLTLTFLFLALLFFLIAYTYHENRRLRSNLKVKVITSRFVHEKLYIGDDTAITGSANLTFSGMHRNIEHIDVIKDREKIKDLSNHFDELWSKY